MYIFFSPVVSILNLSFQSEFMGFISDFVICLEFCRLLEHCLVQNDPIKSEKVSLVVVKFQLSSMNFWIKTLFS